MMRVPGHDRAGQGAEESGNLGQEGHHDENEGDAVADPARGDACSLGEGDDTGIDGVGHCARQACKEIAYASAGQGPLHLPKVDGPIVAPGNSLQ